MIYCLTVRFLMRTKEHEQYLKDPIQSVGSKQDRFLYAAASSKPSTKVQHLRFDFYFKLARPWYDKNDVAFVDEHGIPRDITDLPKLSEGFEAAFASIGATRLNFKKWEDPKEKTCENPECGKIFTAKRSTARFCHDCREDVYALRMLGPKYAELNRERAKKGMKALRDKRISELVEKTAKLERSLR
jgi:hypothetical protein